MLETRTENTIPSAVRTRRRRNRVGGEPASVGLIDPALADAATSPRDRDRMFTVRVSPDDLNAFRQEATRRGLSASDWARRVLLAEAGRPTATTSEDRTFYAMVAGELRKVGVNVNQIARAVNGGRITSAVELKDGLGQLVEVVGVLQLAATNFASGRTRNRRMDRSAPTSRADRSAERRRATER